MTDFSNFTNTILPTPIKARSILRSAIPTLSSRGLLIASKWAAELLVSINLNPNSDLDTNEEMLINHNHQIDETEIHSDLYYLGRSYFDTKEYERATKALSSIKSGPGRFLGLYSKFLAIEKRLNDVSGPALSARQHQRRFTKKHQSLLNELQTSIDPFDLYLKAILLSRQSYRLEAIDALIHSINLYSYNWSAWKFLQKLIEGADELETVLSKLPKDGFMNRFFFVHASLECHNAGNGEDLTKVIEELKELFPTSIYLKSQEALISYNLRDFEISEKIFDEIYTRDPYRIEDVDTYSNILYVMEKRSKLTSLAQNYTSDENGLGVDRMRPEVCCLLGNYWSLSGEHEKAIIEFKRALRLDPNYLSAWTLMGHEYVEMKNTYAAIESYRKAIDANSKDYRAWYGLGQTYEVLDMLSYALHYYQQATALKPYDTRMWLALAQVYEKLGRRREARMTTKRALMNAQPNGTIGGQDDFAMILKLAELYDADGHSDEAAKYHKKLVDETLEFDGGPTAKLAKSLLYLAKYEIKRMETGEGHLISARDYLTTLVRMNVDEKEDAKGLLRKLQNFESQSSKLETNISSIRNQS
ncbi:hypothetical protein CROQUDRAFT_101269 [Cronartium quercuum f. sp. fusiforme G11]|uniref:Cdc23 domain-containing protein n=1 Tax=Cronartium quercuum f. sp. fusiforme G11 TaxID=708437 RepID=A0A9P6N8Y6_9BASI|nr:hypothetical protein CROQUDRAFT_101269 [Cronartium quercuum f. sp. fusiforme G11]